MEHKMLCFAFFCILLAYYVYIPIPENIEEPWKLQIIHAAIKMTSLMATLFENIGLMKYEELFLTLMNLQLTTPVSDENITVIDTDFSDIPVRLYLPKWKSERMRPAVIFIHGGAFVLGSSKLLAYDILNRWTANKLDAVVVGVDFRVAPRHLFPAAVEDSVRVVKFFLQDKILAKYRVDPTRICVTGDSSGSGVATVVIQLLQNDLEHKDKIKAQALIYPALQFVDVFTPSYREYQYGPLLPRDTGIKLASLYVAEDKALVEAVQKNQHMPEGSRHLFNFVNWSVFLPEKYKKNHVYTEPILGKLKVSYPALVDSRLSPLLVNDSHLQSLPLTYILTCEHDLIRDDGFMYATRLRNAGVQVTHDHLENGFHGALSFIPSPFSIHLGFIIRDKYISWLKENL